MVGAAAQMPMTVSAGTERLNCRLSHHLEVTGRAAV